MRRVDRWLHDWAETVIEDCNKSNLSGINTVEKLLKDPGIATDVTNHKVLWWPKNRRVARISKAAHQLTPTEIIILVIHFGFMKSDDGTRFTRLDLSKNSSISPDVFSKLRRDARRKIVKILKGYDKKEKKDW